MCKKELFFLIQIRKTNFILNLEKKIILYFFLFLFLFYKCQQNYKWMRYESVHLQIAQNIVRNLLHSNRLSAGSTLSTSAVRLFCRRPYLFIFVFFNLIIFLAFGHKRSYKHNNFLCITNKSHFGVFIKTSQVFLRSFPTYVVDSQRSLSYKSNFASIDSFNVSPHVKK